MKFASDKTEFQHLLSQLDHDDLSAEQHQRLFALLESHPEWIPDFAAHTQLAEELRSLDDTLLAQHGIDLPERNLVVLPVPPHHPISQRPIRSTRWRNILPTAAAAAIVLLGSWSVLTEPARQVTADQPTSPVAATRDGSRNNDDPNDEAVALSDATALANSRRVRGGQPEGAASVPKTITFNQHVRPILSENCFHCHGPDSKKQKADLRLDVATGATRDLGGYAAIVPGSADTSEAWVRILSTDEDEVMPPPDSHRSLSPADKQILKRWIDEGAVYQDHWAYIPPTQVDLPTVSRPDWPRNGIDSFILARLDSAALPPAPPADPRRLLRRLSLDLIGLPPTPEELAAFEKAHAQDADTAITDAVTRLQASTHYGETMALPWLDAARYADSNGFQQDGDRHQWPWRDWVVRAYNDNMPFDQFTIEQLAGDLLPDPTQDQLIATGFNRNHMINGEGGAIKEEQRVNYVIDRVDTTATTWLGLTIACAQCHDHKYDAISHIEYYQFFAFFNNVPESGGVDKRSSSGCVPGSKRTVQVSNPVLAMPTPEQLATREKLNQEIKQLEQQITANSKAIDAARIEWEKSLKGDFNDRKIYPGALSGILRTPEKDRAPKQIQEVREFFLKTAPVESKNWKQWGTQLTQHRADHRANEEAIIEVMVMAENPPDKMRETHLHLRGDYMQPAEKVTTATPASLPTIQTTEKRPLNRLDLAHWLVNPQHPLTARVTVNRLWQQFFGTGLVKTTEDFGVQGELPSHPELLDWLALEFIESGWDMKHIVRLIATSATYRQSAALTPEKHEHDPENRLLSRSPRYRLPAMLLRDQALAVGGLLRDDLGGIPVYPHQPEGLWEEFSFGKILYGHPDSPDQLYRRSLYTFWRRTLGPPNMFDAATRQVCSVKPSRTNTPLHALTLLNDPTYVEAAHGLAHRMMTRASTPLDRLTLGFTLATGRAPDEQEITVLQRSLQRALATFKQDPQAAEAYLALAPKHLTTPPEPIPTAAYAQVAQVILNLDETLNRP